MNDDASPSETPPTHRASRRGGRGRSRRAGGRLPTWAAVVLALVFAVMTLAFSIGVDQERVLTEEVTGQLLVDGVDGGSGGRLRNFYCDGQVSYTVAGDTYTLAHRVQDYRCPTEAQGPQPVKVRYAPGNPRTIATGDEDYFLYALAGASVLATVGMAGVAVMRGVRALRGRDDAQRARSVP